ncbi:hypothetical protein CF124_05845 [Aeromonas hydrophila]|nr:hypothetical protein CF124_05845 [Aeromonas hydrophila]
MKIRQATCCIQRSFELKPILKKVAKNLSQQQSQHSQHRLTPQEVAEKAKEKHKLGKECALG